MAQYYVLDIPYNYQKEDGCCEKRNLKQTFTNLVSCIEYLQKIVSKEIEIKGNDFIEDKIYNKNIPISLNNDNLIRLELINEKSIMFESLFPINTLFEYFVTIKKI